MKKMRIETSTTLPKRTFFGKFCKYSLIGFNILLVIGIGIWGLTLVNNFISGDYTSYGEMNPTLLIGSGIALVTYLTLWIGGNIFFGLLTFLTRPKRTK